MVDERGYPVLDLSPLLTPGKEYAVRCFSREDARHFVSTMLHQHRDVCNGWVWPNISWEDEDDFCHIDYYPDINKHDGGYMSYDTSGWAEDHPSVIVIPFHEIYANGTEHDFGDLPDADGNILSLLGM